MPRQKIRREQMRAQKTGVLKDCSYSLSYSCWMMHYKMYEFVLHLHLKWKVLYLEPFQSGVGDSSAWRLPCLAKFLWHPRTKFAHSLKHALSGHVCSLRCVRTASHLPQSQAGVTGRVSFPIGFSQWVWNLRAHFLFVLRPKIHTRSLPEMLVCVFTKQTAEV